MDEGVGSASAGFMKFDFCAFMGCQPGGIIMPLHRAMNPRHALILAVTTGLFLIGCMSDEGTRNERHVDRLMRHRDWPLIQQIAEKEVKKREILWPEPAAGYLPAEHKDRVWVVMAIDRDTKEAQRMVMLMIGDDGKVLEYKRYWEGAPVPDFPDAGRVR
jgi:hypothetical protein